MSLSFVGFAYSNFRKGLQITLKFKSLSFLFQNKISNLPGGLLCYFQDQTSYSLKFNTCKGIRNSSVYCMATHWCWNPGSSPETAFYVTWCSFLACVQPWAVDFSKKGCYPHFLKFILPIPASNSLSFVEYLYKDDNVSVFSVFRPKKQVSKITNIILTCRRHMNIINFAPKITWCPAQTHTKWMQTKHAVLLRLSAFIFLGRNRQFINVRWTVACPHVTSACHITNLQRT